MPNDSITALVESAGSRWIDELPDGVLVCDLDGTIVVVNTRMAAMSGYDLGDLVGTSIETLVPAASRGRHPALRATFLDAGAARPMGPGVHLTMLRSDGT